MSSPEQLLLIQRRPRKQARISRAIKRHKDKIFSGLATLAVAGTVFAGAILLTTANEARNCRKFIKNNPMVEPIATVPSFFSSKGAQAFYYVAMPNLFRSFSVGITDTNRVDLLHAASGKHDAKATMIFVKTANGEWMRVKPKKCKKTGCSKEGDSPRIGIRDPI